MKRYYGVHLFISLALGMAIGAFTTLAEQNSNMHDVLYAVMETVALVLNIACLYDKRKRK